LNEVGVPCGPINTIDQVFYDPQIRHLGMAQPVRSHERGDTELVGQPIVMSRTPSRITAPPPLMGEHTDAILADLGYDEAKIAALRDSGVI
jgi:crotonobetainyl-CoA:carnitine CoA-transferase CaiB-like acyl-CoA transferase